MAKKRKKRTTKRKASNIDVGQILLKQRHLFLMNEINMERAQKLVQAMFALDTLNNKPIILTINSPGGSVAAGMSIIDAMKAIKSPVLTFVTGEACSMASLISVCGSKRFMTYNSIWMAHPMTAGGTDYSAFLKDRIKGLELFERVINEVLKKNTKLTPEEITRTARGELWLTAKECKKKGIVDVVILQERR